MAGLKPREVGSRGRKGAGVGRLSPATVRGQERGVRDSAQARLAHFPALGGEVRSDITIGPLGTPWL